MLGIQRLKNLSSTCANYITRITKPSCNKIKMQGNLTKDIFVRSLKTSELNPQKIFSQFEKFEIDEYKALSEPQKNAIRKSMPAEILEKRDAAIKLSSVVQRHLHRRFPNGYVFIPIGRSLSVIGKVLENQGIAVKYCPISNMGRNASSFSFTDVISQLPSTNVLAYKKYLDSISITAENIKNTNLPHVFADFSASGDSIKNFKLLLERPEIGIKGQNVHFAPIKMVLFNGSDVNLFVNNIVLSAFKSNKLNHYSHLSYKDLDKVEQIINQPYSTNCKKLHFAIMDYFNSTQK